MSHNKHRPATQAELRADVELAREDLGQTVEDLAAKAHIRARARERAHVMRENAGRRSTDLRDRAGHTARGARTSRKAPLMAAAGGGSAAILAAVLLRRHAAHSGPGGFAGLGRSTGGMRGRSSSRIPGMGGSRRRASALGRMNPMSGGSTLGGMRRKSRGRFSGTASGGFPGMSRSRGRGKAGTLQALRKATGTRGGRRGRSGGMLGGLRGSGRRSSGPDMMSTLMALKALGALGALSGAKRRGGSATGSMNPMSGGHRQAGRMDALRHATAAHTPGMSSGSGTMSPGAGMDALRSAAARYGATGRR